VTIVEFADFSCPYCARGAATLRRIREEYGDRVRIVFREFPLSIHPQARNAAAAAVCAHEQGKFWEMHDRLFAEQGTVDLNRDVARLAGAVGLDAGRFLSCVGGDAARRIIDTDIGEGQRYGVTGTPTFLVNGRIVRGAGAFEEFARLIDRELSGGSSASTEATRVVP
jgi:protein-disulfide isomerase